MDLFISLAIVSTATIYGMGERNCGDPGKAVPCDSRAITASGEKFDPAAVTAAVPMPANRKMRPKTIWVKNHKGECIEVRLNDKKNPRYVGSGGLDLTPAAVFAITGKVPTRYWSGRIELCGYSS
jgi:hypothetical protein